MVNFNHRCTSLGFHHKYIAVLTGIIRLIYKVFWLLFIFCGNIVATHMSTILQIQIMRHIEVYGNLTKFPIWSVWFRVLALFSSKIYGCKPADNTLIHATDD